MAAVLLPLLGSSEDAPSCLPVCATGSVMLEDADGDAEALLIVDELDVGDVGLARGAEVAVLGLAIGGGLIPLMKR